MSDKPYLLDGHMYQYDLGWMIEQIKQQKKALETALDNQTITYADPIQWDITSQYAPVTIVVNPQTGTAYISKQAVPQGIPLTNTDYWLPIFNYQAGLTPVMQGTALSVETGTTATKDYLVNDLLWYKSVLYRVTRPLAVGDDLTPNYNIIATSVESLLALYYGRDRVAQVANDTVNVSGDYVVHAGDIAETADNITLHSIKDTLIDADGKYTEQITGNKEINVDGSDSVHVDGVTTVNRGGAVTEVYGASVDKTVNGTHTDVYKNTATTTYAGKRLIYGQGCSVDINDLTMALKTKTLPIIFPDKTVDLHKIGDKPVFSIADYGAKGDGVTDDTTAIQACLTAAGANAVIIFPRGTYILSAPVSYYSGQVLWGLGAILMAGDTFPGDNYMIRPQSGTTGGYAANYNNIFYGLGFNANGKQVTSLILGHSTDNKVINCWFTGNSGWHQLEVNSSIYVLVEGCYFTEHTGTGEMLQFDSAQEIGAPGITPYDNTVSRYCTVSNCFFDGSYPSIGDVTTDLAGIGSHSNVANCRDITITGCTFKHCWIGVSFRYVIDVTVTGCLFHECGCGCWFNHLSVTSPVDRSRYVCVRNNTFYTQKNCVDFTPAKAGTVSDKCMITDNQLISVSGNACRPYCDGTSLVHGNVMQGALAPVSGNAAVSHNNLINGTWTA